MGGHDVNWLGQVHPRATERRDRTKQEGGRSQEIHELLPWNFGPATDAD